MAFLILLLLFAIVIYKVNFEEQFARNKSSESEVNSDIFSGTYYWVLGGTALITLLFIMSAFLKKKNY